MFLFDKKKSYNSVSIRCNILDGIILRLFAHEQKKEKKSGEKQLKKKNQQKTRIGKQQE